MDAMTDDERNYGLLSLSLSAAVPLHIMRMKEKGGPDDADFERAREASDLLGQHGDILIYGGGKPGLCATLFNRMAHAAAVLAFCPGGATVMGVHYEANPTRDPDREDPAIVEEDEREDTMNRGPFGVGS
jgi:hypothetical protein